MIDDTEAAPDSGRVDLSSIPTLDVSTLTLGEMAAAELESGRSFEALLMGGRATRRLLALWVAERRSPSSAQPRSWQELASLRPLEGSSSTSRSGRAGRPSPSRR